MIEVEIIEMQAQKTKMNSQLECASGLVLVQIEQSPEPGFADETFQKHPANDSRTTN